MMKSMKSRKTVRLVSPAQLNRAAEKAALKEWRERQREEDPDARRPAQEPPERLTRAEAEALVVKEANKPLLEFLFRPPAGPRKRSVSIATVRQHVALMNERRRQRETKGERFEKILRKLAARKRKQEADRVGKKLKRAKNR